MEAVVGELSWGCGQQGLHGAGPPSSCAPGVPRLRGQSPKRLSDWLSKDTHPWLSRAVKESRSLVLRGGRWAPGLNLP